MFHPGETVIHTFVIPFRRVDLSKVIISYKQEDYVILERTVTSPRDFGEYHNAEGEVDETKTQITIQLTQEESLLFKERWEYRIQLNVYSEGGSRHASCEIKGSSGVQHHKEVISNV